GMIDTSSDILPANTAPPEGEGSFHFSAKIKDLPIGTAVDQAGATITFDSNSSLTTNAWHNTIADPNEHLIAGKSIALTAIAGLDSKRKLSLNLADPQLRSIASPKVNGLRVRVVSEAGDGVYTLDASHWTALVAGTVVKKYKYKDPKNLSGPIKSASIDVA